jgi:predicted thioesterase
VKFLDAVTATHHGQQVTVPHRLGTAVGHIVGIDMTDAPVLIVSVNGRDVRVPIDNVQAVEGGAA